MAELCFNPINLSPMFPNPVAVPDQIRAAAGAGFSQMSLDALSIGAYLKGGGKLEDAAALLSQHGVSCFELMGIELRSDRPDYSLDIARHAARAARVLDATCILAVAYSPVDAALADLFRRCCDLAAESGARVAFEIMAWTPVRRISEGIELIERSQDTQAGLILDVWHFLRGPDTWSDLETMPVECLSHIQFDDALPAESDDLEREATTRRALPGEGVFELDRFCSVLRNKGFDGTVSIEVLSPETRALGAETFARRAFETTERYWG